jgi:uncharacterized membrane protein YebE (DUF533 family)
LLYKEPSQTNQKTMDAVKILGSLLANNAMGSKSGSNILNTLLGGGNNRSGQSGNHNLAGDILGALLGGSQRKGGNAGLGALGALLGAAASNQSKGGSGLDALGALLGGGNPGGSGGGRGLEALAGLLGGQKGSGGGLGAIAELLSGAQKSNPAAGGLAGLIGGLLGGGQQPAAAAGGLGGLLGAMAGGASGSDLLGALLGAAPGPLSAPPREAQQEAEILIEAMCNAAKADGQIDAVEREKILKKLGDLDQNELDFVKRQLAAPLNLDDFISRVPKDMAQQVYAFSLMAVKLDSQAEAQYFARLAGGLGIDGQTANQIHAQMGEPQIFA